MLEEEGVYLANRLSCRNTLKDSTKRGSQA